MYLAQTQCYYRNQKSIISLALDWIIKKFTYIIITVPVAQWIARWTSNPKVVGSNPTGDAKIFICFKLRANSLQHFVEHD